MFIVYLLILILYVIKFIYIIIFNCLNKNNVVGLHIIIYIVLYLLLLLYV